MKSKILFALLGLLCCTIVSDATAQPLEKKGPQKHLSPELIARRKTEQMDKLLQLTEKQFKKIFKLNLKEAKSIEAQRKGRHEGMPPMPGMGSKHLSDRPPMRGEGRPPMDDHFRGRGDMNRPHPEAPKDPETLKKEAQKRDKKLKKILTKDQYNIWIEHQKKDQCPNLKKSYKRKNCGKVSIYNY